MSSFNTVILVGNLAADPEIKPTSQGSRIARMRLITSDTYKDKEGNRKENSHGHNIVVFNERLVDVIESYARKGQKIAIQGKLENRTWTDSDDVKHYATEVVLPRYGGEFRMLGRNGEEIQPGDDDRGGDSNRSSGGDRGQRSEGRSDDRGGNRGRDDNRRDDSRGSGRADTRPARDDTDLDDDVPF